MTGRAYGIAPAGTPLPDAAHPGQVTLAVTNLDRSREFYEGILGLRVIQGMDAALTMGPAGDGRPLVELHTSPGLRRARRGASGLFHFALLVPDRAALGRFVAHATRHHVPLGSADHAVSEALYLHDPDGLGIEVYADRPRDTWRHTGRQLFMTTAPLDIESLLDAAGDAPWTGLPAGTRMGHVHLHVGDLGQAEAFYHSALGFEKMAWDFPGALFLSAGGYHHHLGLNTWGRGAPATPDEARLLAWDLHVPDVEAIATRMIDAGLPVEHQAARTLISDPWGTPVRLQPLRSPADRR